MNKLFVSLAFAALSVFAAKADVVTSEPFPLFQDSENVVITYHPNDEGSNKVLANLPASTPIYAHVGVITNASTSDSDWKHAPTWKDNSEKYKLTYVGPNEYTLNIGNINQYFGLSSTETVKKIAFVFRDATASKEGKSNLGGDIFLEVMSSDKPTLTVTYEPNSTKFMVGDQMSVKIISSVKSELSFYIKDGPMLATASNANILEYTHTFTEAGKPQFIASNGGVNADKKRTVTVVDGGTPVDYPGGVPKMGTVRNGDGSVTFCLAAPQIASVKLIGSWDGDNWDESLDSQVMNHCVYEGNRYFWLTVPGLDSQKQYFYYYLVEDSKRVADPYSKLVLNKSLDKYDNMAENWEAGEMPLPAFPEACKSNLLTVYQEDINDYRWAPFTIPDHTSLYIYEMLFRDFTGTEGESRGDGTVRAAIEKIPYLKSLGINAVELMPIMEFTGNKSWGYNTDYYMAPDKVYGSPVDYKDFINECHKNGIAVILDIVFNQCQDHPWYSMYSSTANNPFINASAPHDYSVLNDWNQDNPIVAQHWDDVLKYWLTEYNVDGFRFDLVKGLGDNASYGSGTEAYNQSRVDRMKRLHAAISSVKPDGIHINEFLGGAQEEKEYAADGQLVWAKYSDNCYSFAKGSGNPALHYLSGQGTSVSWANRITYAESHDEQRVAYNAYNSGTTGVKGNWEVISKRIGSLAVQHLLSPGPKMIWQFEEMCNDQTTKKGNDNDTGNKKVLWSYLENENFKAVNDIYATLGNLRNDNPALFTNANTYKYAGMSTSNFATMRTMTLFYGDMEVIAFINPSITGNAQTISVAPNLMSVDNSQLICATPGAVPTLTQNGTKLEVNVAPNSFVVYATKSVQGIEDAVIGGNDEGASFEVYGGEGEIIIVGHYDSAEVYNIQGRAMGRLDNLDRGIYIVRVDGHAAKVSVR